MTNKVNIENLTVAELRSLMGMVECLSKTVPNTSKASSSENSSTFTPHIGKKCIIRTYASGVFFGTLVKQEGRMVELKDCRRLWSWKAVNSISLSAVATEGVVPSKCKFPQVTAEHTILDALEIIPASSKCIETIQNTPVTTAV